MLAVTFWRQQSRLTQIIRPSATYLAALPVSHWPQAASIILYQAYSLSIIHKGYRLLKSLLTIKLHAYFIFIYYKILKIIKMYQKVGVCNYFLRIGDSEFLN